MDHSDQKALKVIEGAAAEAVDEQGFERLEAVDTLTPGHYWRCSQDLQVERPGWEGQVEQLARDASTTCRQSA